MTPPHSWSTRLVARAIRATSVVDRAAGYFDRLRTRTVLAIGSDAFLDAYTDIAYARDASYRSANVAARRGLFDWEKRVLRDHAPAPPARILVGAAGGGRETLPLLEMGYRVTAFDPVPALTASLVEIAATNPRLEPLLGRYADLPTVRRAADPATAVDLRTDGPFDAAILGWSSFSHGRSDAARVESLRAMAALTHGPIIVSYFTSLSRKAETGGEAFSLSIGYYREITDAELRQFATDAGLRVSYLDEDATVAVLLRL